MVVSRVIPNYDLYGDSSRHEGSAPFNFEWIPQRSTLYNWLIHPHRHDSFIQVLYLTEGHVDVQIEHAQQTLHAPCVMLIPAGHVHGFRFSQDTNGPVVTDMQKALESALAQIERQFGKGSIMKLGADNPVMDIEATSTGSLGLDIALGIGGLPQGRIIEIYGPESSGKTTLTLHVVAEAQKKGGVCAFVDAEHALDPQYAKKLGVNLDELLISQPDTGEQALEIVDTLVRSGAVNVIVVDSVAALVPKSEIEGDMGDMQMGSQARLMSQAMRKLTASIGRSNTMVIFINQIRMKIGVMFGSPETTTGGNALKFYASVRLDIRRIGAIKDRDEVIGNSTRVKVVKNKVSPPFREVEFDIMYGQGISKVGELVDIGVKAGVVEKSGSWYSYKDERIGQGRENAKSFLKQNPAVAQDIEDRIRGANGLDFAIAPEDTPILDE